MATITSVSLIDDLTGSQADETVRFGLDGRHYTIDLSGENAGALRDALAPFITNARQSRAHVAEDATQIRAWAHKRGYAVTTRGRLSNEIVEAYRKAHA